MSENTPTIEAPKSRLPLIAGIVALVVALALVAFFLTRGDDSTAADGETVRIGVVGASDPYWDEFVDAAAEEGIDVELRDFTDYTQPNPALAAGELDLNQFQHSAYLADYNVAEGQDLTPIGATATYPLGLYSTQYESVEDIPDGATVAVPDDTTNQARGLLVLQEAGLIELADGGTIFSDLQDVEDSSRVEVTQLAADTTVTSLDDVAAAIVNNDFVERAGLSFEDALATDDAESPASLPYVNIFVARAEDADNPTYLRLVEIFQETQSVTDGLQEVSGGTAVLLRTPAEELQANLRDVEELTREQRG